MEELIALSISAEDYDPLKSWKLVSWCKKQGADEWTLAAVTYSGTAMSAGMALFDRFEERIESFRLPTAKRRSLTAQRPLSQNNFIKLTELWRLNSKSLAVVQEMLPEGLFAHQVQKDGWFKDPVFYRRGEFMLGVVSHEHEGIIRVTKAEHRLLEAEGFVFRPRGLYVGY